MKNAKWQNHWDSLNRLYPRYRANMLPYSIDLEVMANFPTVRLKDFNGQVPKSNDVLIDNSTLLCCLELTASDDPHCEFDLSSICEPSASGADSCLDHLITSLIIYDRLIVDGFVFANSPLAQRIAQLFPGVIVPLFMSNRERYDFDHFMVNAIEDPTVLNKYIGREEYDGRASRHLRQWFMADEVERNFYSDWYLDWNRHLGLISDHATEYVWNNSLFIRNSGDWEYRVYYYLLIANMAGLPYLPHPGRVVLIGEAWSRTEGSRILEYFDKHLLTVLRERLSVLTEVSGSIPLPGVTPLVAQEVRNGKSLREAILTVRNSKKAVAFRKWCLELRQLLNAPSADPAAVLHEVSKLENQIAVWAEDLNEGVGYKTRKLTVGSGPGWLKLGLDFAKLKDPYLFRANRPGILFLNDLAKAYASEVLRLRSR